VIDERNRLLSLIAVRSYGCRAIAPRPLSMPVVN